MIRVFEAFAGYGSQSLALERLKRHFPEFNYEVVGISEIDKYAVTAYNALHGDVPNYGDISKTDWNDVPDFDLFTMSSPCQDFSFAGTQKGGEEGSGTRSSLLWEYILMENVKALVSAKFKPLFMKWQNELASYGYTNFVKILDSQHYGVPQHRERVFMVSILDENASYHFPEPFPLDRGIKDILEEDVDDRYFLSEKLTKTVLSDGKNGFLGGTGVRTVDDILAPTIKAGCYKTRRDDCFIKYPSDNTICLNSKVDGKQPSLTDRVYSAAAATAVTTGFHPMVCIGSAQKNAYKGSVKEPSPTIAEACGMGGGQTPMVVYKGHGYENGDGLYTATSKNFTRSGFKGISRTIKAEKHDAGVCDDYRIRKLTPRECLRLMDVDDADIDKLMAAGISNTQLYKMAGNSIVVSCLYHIFRKLFIDTSCESEQLSLF